MTLKEIRERCVERQLAINQLRTVSDNYEEMVIYVKDLDGWIEVLSEFLDFPVKPAGTDPTGQDQKYAKEFGGIQTEQIMFRKIDGKQVFLAMFWPWRDAAHITLKTAIVRK